MVKDIVTAPAPVLTKKAKPVTSLDKKTRTLIRDLKETLAAQNDPIGVGISGNQLDFLQRIFVLRPDEDAQMRVCINPEITDVDEGSDDREPTLEGCLSIPTMWGHVLRPEKVKLKYMSPAEKMHEIWLDGFASVVAQHELDHLNGILFTQRVLEQGRGMFKEEDGELYEVDFG